MTTDYITTIKMIITILGYFLSHLISNLSKINKVKGLNQNIHWLYIFLFFFKSKLVRRCIQQLKTSFNSFNSLLSMNQCGLRESYFIIFFSSFFENSKQDLSIIYVWHTLEFANLRLITFFIGNFLLSWF